MDSSSSGTRNLGPLIGAIDQGTSSSRFLVFTSNGELVTYHQVPVTTLNPHQGWSESDPEELLDTVVQCIDATVENLRKLDIDPQDVVAVGVTNQRETTIVWDKVTGLPLYNAILWHDVRTQPIVEGITASLPRLFGVSQQYVERVSGLPISTYFSAVKLRWLFENVPEVQECFEKGNLLFGTVDTWLIWKLTKGSRHLTDVTNASRTLLMSLENLQWDPTLCNLFEIPVSILPEIRSCSEIYGSLRLSSLAGVPISSCIGDQQSALVGQNCFRPGQAKCTYGTGAFLVCNVGSKIILSEHGLISTVAYQLGKDQPPVYALEGSIAVAGSGVTWLEKNLGLLRDAAHIEELAAQVEDTGDVYIVPAFSGLFAPYWRSDARGLICGLTQFSCREHICRAMLESVSYQTRDVLEAIQIDSKLEISSLLVDGGLSQNNLLLQILSDILGIPILRPSVLETTSLGAASLAGQAQGIEVWQTKIVNTEENVISIDRYQSRITSDQRDLKYERWKDAVERSIGWVTPQTDVTSASDKLHASVAPSIFVATSFVLWFIADWLNSRV